MQDWEQGWSTRQDDKILWQQRLYTHGGGEHRWKQSRIRDEVRPGTQEEGQVTWNERTVTFQNKTWISQDKKTQDRTSLTAMWQHPSRTCPLRSPWRRVLETDLQVASTIVKWDSLVFGAFPGCITRCSHPYLYITIYAAQVRESDKKSKVWLSDLFELQEFLISFLILLLVEDYLSPAERTVER